ncbi:MAG TPA: PAS domain S-box protein [Candidatus Saccharimonadales bacterium]|nr:PAS domain S-box protein [Candidatus Saccharimonadales bacterium]
MKSKGPHGRPFRRVDRSARGLLPLLQIQYAASKVLASAENLEAALPSMIASICLNLGWELGAFWRHASNRPVLICTHISAADKALGTFIAESRKNELLPGEGLPGRVFAGSAPEWIANIHEDRDAARSMAAAGAGLQSAFAFPILVDDDAIAVLEFFSYTFRAPDQELLETMVVLGRQVGQFIKRKEAEEALHSSLELHRSLTDSASDAIITVDESSNILLANIATEKLFGYPVSELKGQSMIMLMPEYLRHRHQQAMAQYMKSGRKRMRWQGIELAGRHRDGHEMLLEVSLGEFTLRGQQLFTGFIRDITERRRIEENAKFIERLTVTGHSAASLGHEISAPLNSFRDIFRALTQSSGPDQAARIACGEQELRSIAEIIQRTQALANLPGPTDAGTLLDESALLLSHRIRQQNINIEKRYRAMKPVGGAAGELLQVFVILMANALDAVGPHGKLWLRTHLSRTDPARTNPARTDPTRTNSAGTNPGAESLVILIADNGRGIPDEVQGQIFKPLFTTKDKAGAGLSLWIARPILQKYRARIEFRSRTTGRWQGTCFRITIPLPLAA